MNARKPRLIFRRCILPVLAVLLFACASAEAQTATGRIIGTATDAQGAAIAGAKIAVTNTGTNVRSTNLVKETAKLVFRVEAFNLFNHTEFRPPAATSFASGTFGQIARTYDPRIVQLLKLTF